MIWQNWTGPRSLVEHGYPEKTGTPRTRAGSRGRQVRSKADDKLTGMALEFAGLRISRRFSELATGQQAEKQLHDIGQFRQVAGFRQIFGL